jgi:hypothetical protein
MPGVRPLASGIFVAKVPRSQRLSIIARKVFVSRTPIWQLLARYVPLGDRSPEDLGERLGVSDARGSSACQEPGAQRRARSRGEPTGLLCSAGWGAAMPVKRGLGSRRDLVRTTLVGAKQRDGERWSRPPSQVARDGPFRCWIKPVGVEGRRPAIRSPRRG